MKKETEFFKDATIERVRNRIVLFYMDLNKKVHIRTKMMNEVYKFKKMIKELEDKIDNLTTEIMEYRAEIDLCEVFLLGAKKAGATNADSPIQHLNVKKDGEENLDDDIDNDDEDFDDDDFDEDEDDLDEDEDELDDDECADNVNSESNADDCQTRAKKLLKKMLDEKADIDAV